jgi:predicted NBD/HSP70 family sugar kinase
MDLGNTTSKPIPLTDLPINILHDSQLEKFSRNSIHVERIIDFDPEAAVKALGVKEGKRVIAADYGGDKGITRVFEVKNGRLVQAQDFRDDVHGNDGEGYLASLKKAAQFADDNSLPFGISWGGPLDGSKLLFHPKAKIFYNQLKEEFDGDLSKLSPNVKISLNDGPAGLVSAAVEAYRQFKADSVIFIINGGGIGLGILKDGSIYATEAGHVEGINELNLYNQQTPCGVFNSTYVCLERLGANKTGIESHWETKTGHYLRAKDIEDRYIAGDSFAAALYDNSADVVSHVIAGSARAIGIDLSNATTAVVCHGGAFKFPHYGKRINQILDNHLGNKINLILTKDFTNKDSNACLDGAAIAALTMD